MSIVDSVLFDILAARLGKTCARHGIPEAAARDLANDLRETKASYFQVTRKRQKPPFAEVHPAFRDLIHEPVTE